MAPQPAPSRLSLCFVLLSSSQPSNLQFQNQSHQHRHHYQQPGESTAKLDQLHIFYCRLALLCLVKPNASPTPLEKNWKKALIYKYKYKYTNLKISHINLNEMQVFVSSCSNLLEWTYVPVSQPWSHIQSNIYETICQKRTSLQAR